MGKNLGLSLDLDDMMGKLSWGLSWGYHGVISLIFGCGSKWKT
jgi:hypothetical protein